MVKKAVDHTGFPEGTNSKPCLKCFNILGPLNQPSTLLTRNEVMIGPNKEKSCWPLRLRYLIFEFGSGAVNLPACQGRKKKGEICQAHVKSIGRKGRKKKNKLAHHMRWSGLFDVWLRCQLVRLQPTLRIFFSLPWAWRCRSVHVFKAPHLRFPAMPCDGMILYCRYGTPYC